jgi:hypothetical protein
LAFLQQNIYTWQTRRLAPTKIHLLGFYYELISIQSFAWMVTHGHG